ncbi:DNA cytosine methyltransferase [Limnospira fusiformis NRMCF6962]
MFASCFFGENLTVTKRPIAIDLFAGCGGMSLGLEAAGFDVAVAVEFDAVHCLVHHFNFPYCHTICRDISKVTSAEILEQLQLKYQDTQVDLIAGGPPCQGFSHIGKRQLDDPRNSLVFEYLRMIAEIQPKYFIFENVPGIATGKHKRFLNELITEFEAIGYQIQKPIKILDASEYGAPQKRKRLILIGSRFDVKIAGYPATNKSEMFTVYQAISDLETIDHFTNYDPGISPAFLEYEGDRKKYSLVPSDSFSLCHKRTIEPTVYGHVGSVHTPLSIARFAETPPGTVEPKSRFFKLSPTGLCNTLRAGTNSDKGAYTAPRPIHYSIPRCITIREAARLHTFPDWFQFHRTIWHGFREIGNAVIPILAKQLGGSVIDALGVDVNQLKSTTLAQVPESLLSYNISQACSYWGISDYVIPKRKRLR